MTTNTETLAFEAIKKLVSADTETDILTIFKNTFATMQIKCITYRPTEVKYNLDNTQTYKFHLQFEKKITTPGMFWGEYKTHRKIEIANLNIALSMLDVLKASTARTVFLQNYGSSKPHTYKLSNAIPRITEYIESTHDFISICFEITINDENRSIIENSANIIKIHTYDNSETMLSHAIPINDVSAPSAPSKLAALYGGYTA